MKYTETAEMINYKGEIFFLLITSAVSEYLAVSGYSSVDSILIFSSYIKYQLGNAALVT